MTLDARVRALGDLRTAPLFDRVVDLDPRLDFGAGPFGQRVLFGSAGVPQYAWLNDIVCVGQGYLIERGIAYKVLQVL